MSLLRIASGSVVVSAIFLCLSLPAAAAELAEAGATGTLKVKVTVTGSGRVGSEGAGWDYYDWRVDNSGDLTFNLTAMEPNVDASQFAAMSGGGDADWEQAYDDKFDACNGDAACEMRVTQQRMQDPRGQSNMAAAMSMMQKMQTGEIDMTPSTQTWTIPVGVVRGAVSVRDRKDTYGIIDTGGGPPVDTHCTTSGAASLDRKPSGYGDLAPILTIDSKKSTYELHLVVDEYIDAENSCEPGRKGSYGLLRSPAKDAASWPESLVVTGKLDPGARAAFSGKKSWKGDRSGYGAEPITVTASWSFVEDAR